MWVVMKTFRMDKRIIEIGQSGVPGFVLIPTYLILIIIEIFLKFEILVKLFTTM